MKKVTLKEIAKQTGVSTATVSYVLNNVANQTIAEETRTRILETAKALGYVPNLAARSLVKQQSGLVGLLINMPEKTTSWGLLRYNELIHDIELEFNKHGYHLIIHRLNANSPKLDIVAERKLDGVIVVDAKSEHFHHISGHFPYGVPLLIIDSMIDDPLFKQIIFDYEDAFTRISSLIKQPDKYYAVLDNYNNQQLMQYIVKLLPLPQEQIYIMTSEQELKQFLSKQNDKKGIIINEAIALIAAKYTPSEQLTVICTVGMSQLLPPSSAAITFSQSKGTIAAAQLINLLQKSAPNQGHNSKTYKIKAE